jgi:aromatic amino acid aminotransferase I
MPSVEQPPIQIDYERYYSLESKQRKRSQLKELRPYFEIPGMISVSSTLMA